MEIAQSLLSKPIGSYKHFTFILRGNKILSIGWNDLHANDAKINGKYIKYPLGGIHSEAAAIEKLNDFNNCRKLTLLNIRLNKKGILRLSKPCEHCNNLLLAIGFNKIYYSTNEGFIKI
jgi:deoxycytidylate deaminase